MKAPTNYLKAEVKRLDDAALPYYARKASHIMYTCFRPLDHERFFKDLRKELSRTDMVGKTIGEVLAEKHSSSGYLVYDIQRFFKDMLQRYTVPRILKALDDPPELPPVAGFKLQEYEPDYLKHDYSLIV